MGGTEVTRGVVRVATGVRWYVRELMGDARYERYVRHLRAEHPDAAVPSEREYWRARYADQDANPTSRCC